MRLDWISLSDREVPWYIQLLGLVILIGAAVLGWIALEDSLALIALVWLWTGGSLVGVFIEAVLVRNTFIEWQILRERRSGNSSLTLIAQANLRREIFRMLQYVALFIIGINVLWPFGGTALARAMLVVVVALIIGNTLLDYRERRETAKILRRAARAQPKPEMTAGMMRDKE